MPPLKICTGCNKLTPTNPCPPCKAERQRAYWRAHDRKRQRQRQQQRGNTTQRGYGAQHQRLRAAALREYRPTDPCARCGLPLGTDKTQIDLGHTDDRTGYNGLEHAVCNRSQGRRSPITG